MPEQAPHYHDPAPAPVDPGRAALPIAASPLLFGTYTLTLVNAVASDGRPTLEARRRLLGAGSIYVGAVFITYFIIGLGLLSFLGWLGRCHLVAPIAAGVALIMGA